MQQEDKGLPPVWDEKRKEYVWKMPADQYGNSLGSMAHLRRLMAEDDKAKGEEHGEDYQAERG
jgi:hypothetical protein